MSRTRVLTIALFMVLAAATVWAAVGAMSVQVKNSQLRATPSFLGSTAASVSYGEQVEVLQEQGDWAEVSAAGGKKGWIHQSALTRKKIVLNASGKDAELAASGDELALAGKGFNADVEARFRASHRDVDFASVDRMEAMTVSPAEMIVFLKEGGLKSRTGGAQ